MGLWWLRAASSCGSKQGVGTWLRATWETSPLIKNTCESYLRSWSVCPCMGTGQGGWPQPPQDSVEGGAQPGGSTGWVQAQLPCQVPSCRCQMCQQSGAWGPP